MAYYSPYEIRGSMPYHYQVPHNKETSPCIPTAENKYLYEFFPNWLEISQASMILGDPRDLYEFFQYLKESVEPTPFNNLVMKPESVFKYLFIV